MSHVVCKPFATICSGDMSDNISSVHKVRDSTMHLHTQAVLAGAPERSAFQADQYDCPLAGKGSWHSNLRRWARMPNAILAAKPASCSHCLFGLTVTLTSLSDKGRSLSLPKSQLLSTSDLADQATSNLTALIVHDWNPLLVQFDRVLLAL